MSASPASQSAVVWRPDAQMIASANLTAFMAATGTSDYEQLCRRSTADPAWFWNVLQRQFELRFATPYSQIVDVTDGPAFARWCIGGTTNIVTNCLDRHRGTAIMQKAAIDWEGEDGRRRTRTYAEVDVEVCRLANALRAKGLGRGDVIAIYMPMIPEVATALLAILKIGAIALPLFSGFGASAITDRLLDSGAKAVLTADGTSRRGKSIIMKPALDDALRQTPLVQHVIVVRHSGANVAMQAGRDQWWHIALGAQAETAETTIVPADDPAILIFTSGTTGKAKGAILTHCGFAAKLALDLGLCLDFKSSDRMLWMTDIGWLVGPIVVLGVTLLGGTLVIAEGAPDYPQQGRIWRLVQDFGVTFLGVAPTVVRTFMQYGPESATQYDLSSLRILASTGEPWNPDSWMWIFEHVGKSKVPLLNYAGGTEISGGIITGTVLHPLKPCSFAGPIPGMGAAVVDDQGRDVAAGEVGELALRVPSMGLTRGMWNDTQRYLDTYWSTIPGLWVHGDFASIDADGFWYLHGRSDDTIKVAGKRVGPSEIESCLAATGEIVEAAVVGIADPVKGQALACVCVAPTPSAALADRLILAVVQAFGPAFKPQRVLFVPDLPKTRNMKIMRRVVRAVLEGKSPGNLASLVNPETIAALETAAAS